MTTEIGRNYTEENTSMTTTTKTPSKPRAAVPDALDPNGLNLTTPTAEAAEAIRLLEGQRAGLNKRRAEHDVERQRLAYAARAQGDAAASKRLSAMADEAIRHEHELRDIEAALTTAREHLREAQEDEASAQDRGAARRVRELGNSIAARLTRADEFYAAAAAELNAANDEQAAINALGEAYPSAPQFRLNMIPAIQTAIMQLPQSWWRDWSKFLPPGERRNFSGVWSRMHGPLEGRIRQRLGESERTDTEAA
jgi:hypothetical protein